MLVWCAALALVDQLAKGLRVRSNRITNRDEAEVDLVDQPEIHPWQDVQMGVSSAMQDQVVRPGETAAAQP